MKPKCGSWIYNEEREWEKVTWWGPKEWKRRCVDGAIVSIFCGGGGLAEKGTGTSISDEDKNTRSFRESWWHILLNYMID